MRRSTMRVSAAAEELEPRLLFAVPAGFAETVVASGITGPASMAVAPDGRAFVARQNGNVVVVKDGHVLSTPFVNLLEDDDGERGLLGITLDPDFTTNHYVYVYYTRDDPAPLVSHNVVSRLTADGDVAAPGSERILLELPDVGDAIWHMGGGLRFGPDGKLYVGVGDHQQPGNAQLLSVPTGKILRINKDGSIPADNPFYGQTTGVNRAIWATGVRNPFSIAFQPGTGRFYVNDVGGGAYEEIDEGAAGRNFGWPETEGPFAGPEFPTYANPLYAYHHDGNAACVVGGAFYDGVAQSFPQQYRGQYFFADYSQGWIRTLDPASGAVADFAAGFDSPVTVAAAPDGALWVLTRGPGQNTGAVHRIAYAPPPPAEVMGRQVFYNNSAFDGRDAGANAADDGAVAPDKSALPPGQPAGFANVTSYVNGINGVMVDLRGAWGQVGLDDFQFDVGTGAAGASWSPAPAPTALTLRRGAGAGGSDRLTLVWPDRAVRNTWLRVTVMAGSATGLAQPDVFYFGNQVGETGFGTGDDDTAFTVDTSDLIGLRRQMLPRRPAPITSPFDFNRDGRVGAVDLVAVRTFLRSSLPVLNAAAAVRRSVTSLLLRWDRDR